MQNTTNLIGIKQKFVNPIDIPWSISDAVVNMERAGKLFEEEEYFIPEFLMCSDVMYAGME